VVARLATTLRPIATVSCDPEWAVVGAVLPHAAVSEAVADDSAYLVTARYRAAVEFALDPALPAPGITIVVRARRDEDVEQVALVVELFGPDGQIGVGSVYPAGFWSEMPLVFTLAVPKQLTVRITSNDEIAPGELRAPLLISQVYAVLPNTGGTP
jgi:hypothetical protein